MLGDVNSSMLLVMSDAARTGFRGHISKLQIFNHFEILT